MKSASLLLLAGLVLFAEEPKNLLKPINKAESWRLEQHEGGQGTLKIVDDTVVIASTKVTGTDWHVQAVMTDLDLQEGKDYVLKLTAKAEALCTIGVNAMIDEEDWHQIGLGEEEFRFRAEGVSKTKKNRISIVVGYERCAVTIKAMTLMAK
jgi:hypothetical protein